MTVADCIAWLESFAPLELAESWDNVGLLLGDRAAPVRRILTCLTLTPDVADEAVAERVDLIVTHHPVLFRPVQRLTSDTIEGAQLLRLARSGISVYSPHTAFDSARDGINQQLAEGFGLKEIAPLRAREAAGSREAASIGSGRWGRLDAPVSGASLLRRCCALLPACGVQFVGDADRSVTRMAVACGAAAEFLPDAIRAGCDVLLTGEARFHACLEARAAGLLLILAGHYATERPAVERLATVLADQFPDLDVWASRVERDPVQWSLP